MSAKIDWFQAIQEKQRLCRFGSMNICSWFIFSDENKKSWQNEMTSSPQMQSISEYFTKILSWSWKLELFNPHDGPRWLFVRFSLKLHFCNKQKKQRCPSKFFKFQMVFHSFNSMFAETLSHSECFNFASKLQNHRLKSAYQILIAKTQS